MKPSSRPPRTPSRLSDSLHRKLNMYALAASASGVGALAFACPAEGKIIYTPTHRVIGPNSTYNLDLNHDGTTDFKFRNLWTSTTDLGPQGILSLNPAQAGNGVRGSGSMFFHYDLALAAGVQVGAKGPFLYFSFNPMVLGISTKCWGPWTNVKNRYLGLKFMVNGKPHFGWARANVSCNLSDFKITAVLTGYAYETIPNKAIIAGKTKGPDVITVEPATLGRLALGRN